MKIKREIVRFADGTVIQTSTLHKQFDYGISYYRKTHGVATLKTSYEVMLGKYYSVKSFDPAQTVLVDVKSRPTFRQFRYYASKVLSKKDREIIKTSKAEYRNNKRITLGSSETDVYAPYDTVEMDAVEFDVSLVDKNNNKISVGRPIVYLMKDVLTRMIIAAGIGFDNNSVIGCTNCFANLNENKEELCRKYDLPFEDKYVWLTGYKPRRLRFDNGSDFISDDLERICGALNIQRDTVPPASGSLKGVIERSFRDAHDKLNHMFEGYGHIKMTYDSKHHEESTLNIDQFTRMFYLYILTYNTTENKGIPLTKDMVEKGIPKIPCEAMKYYLSLMSPQRLPEGDEFLAILLRKGTGKLSGDGITFNNLRYMNFEDEDLFLQMQDLHRKRVPFPLLYDPRTVNLVYYISNDQLKRAPLNLNVKAQYTYQNMTFKEYDDLRKLARKTSAAAEELSLRKRIDAYKQIKETIDSAIKDTKSDKKNLREHREAAKQQRSKEQALEGRISPQEEPKQTTQPTAVETKYDFLKDKSLSPTEKLRLLAMKGLKD